MPPSVPPSSGPDAMPSPSAASYRMMAPRRPPVAAATMAVSAVAIKSALPRPQTPRNATISPIEPDSPASVEKATMIARPARIVRLTPIRDETYPVISMATPVTRK